MKFVVEQQGARRFYFGTLEAEDETSALALLVEVLTATSQKGHHIDDCFFEEVEIDGHLVRAQPYRVDADEVIPCHQCFFILSDEVELSLGAVS